MFKIMHKVIWQVINDAFELWCWRRLLRVPWTARRSNQFILKEISPGCSLMDGELMLKDWCWSWNSSTLATSLEELTQWKRPWCWERLRAGWEGDDRGWDGWRASPTQWAWVWANSGSWWWTGRPGMLRFMGSQSVGHDWATELNWIEWYFWGNNLCPLFLQYAFFSLVFQKWVIGLCSLLPGRDMAR